MFERYILQTVATAKRYSYSGASLSHLRYSQFVYKRQCICTCNEPPCLEIKILLSNFSSADSIACLSVLIVVVVAAAAAAIVVVHCVSKNAPLY